MSATSPSVGGSPKLLHFWEWKDDCNSWNPYHHADNMLIEAAFQSGVSEFKTTALSFNTEHQSQYVYNFVKLTQKNLDSGRTRSLRRVESTVGEDEEGFCVALGHTVSLHPALALPSPPLPAAAPTPAASPPSKKPRFEFPSLAVDISTIVAPLPATVAAADTVAAAPPSPAPPAAPSTSASLMAAVTAVDPAVAASQSALGAQSKRFQKYDLGPVAVHPHGKACFDTMLYREKQLCGEYAVFYHSYSFAALLYEVQAAVAAVLFRFKSEFASLPRLLKAPYGDLPDAAALLALFPKLPSRDHDPRFRAVAICGTSSVLAGDSEAPPKSVFLSGYSCSDLSFTAVLENLLVSCGVPAAQKVLLAQKIVRLSEKHGLDCTQFGGKGCSSKMPGHLLQIFVKRTLVDTYVYPAMPFGVFDPSRKPLSKYLEGAGPIQGQVRIVTNPSVFMRGHAVRMYVYSADASFHTNRPSFQKELTGLLHPIIGTSSTRVAAATGIYGGSLPSWFNPDDKEKATKDDAAAAASAS